jgi:FixJ family two-component response regulator
MPRLTVVDDDQSVRESLHGLLSSIGYSVESFASARAFLDSPSVATTDCLILDVRMPEMGGLELQDELTARHIDIPTIFVTAYAEDAVRRRVLAGAAVGCLLKPFSEEALLHAIGSALARGG